MQQKYVQGIFIKDLGNKFMKETFFFIKQSNDSSSHILNVKK